MSTAEKFEVLQAELDQALAEILKLKRQLQDQSDQLRCLTVDLRNCNFQGYNPDGSEPILFETRPDGLREVVGIKMDGWYCEGPRKENLS